VVPHFASWIRLERYADEIASAIAPVQAGAYVELSLPWSLGSQKAAGRFAHPAA